MGVYPSSLAANRFSPSAPVFVETTEMTLAIKGWQTSRRRECLKLRTAWWGELPAKGKQKCDPHDFGSVGILNLLRFPFAGKFRPAHAKIAARLPIEKFFTLLTAKHSESVFAVLLHGLEIIKRHSGRQLNLLK